MTMTTMMTMTTEAFAERALAARTTLVLAVPGPRAAVFNTLADIEALPRWAGGFCEALYLRGGRWVGLTALGEIFLEISADAAAGEITLAAGWRAEAMRSCMVRVGAGGGGSARVMLCAENAGDELQARWQAAVATALREWAARRCAQTGPKGCERAG